MPSLYPNYIDEFTTKLDKTETQAGDIVWASHVNDLQDSVVAIQSALGAKVGGDYPTLGDRLTSIEKKDIPLFHLKRTCLYAGNPLLVNDAGNDIGLAVDTFGQLDNIILVESLNASDYAQHDSLLTFIQKLSERNTNVYGIVTAEFDGYGVSTTATLQSISRWKDLGAKGIFLNGIDQASRTSQNNLLDYIHDNGMSVMLEAIDAHYSDSVTVLNPNGELLNALNTDTFIIFDIESIALYDGIVSKVNDLHNIGYGSEIHGIAHDGASSVEFITAFAHILGLDGVSVQNEDTINDVISINAYIPLIAPVNKPSHDLAFSGNMLSRITNIGNISINIDTVTCQYTAYKIPSAFVDMSTGITVTSGMIEDVVIPAINAYSGSEVIAVSKIASYTQANYAKLQGGILGYFNTNPHDTQAPIMTILEQDTGTGATGVQVLFENLLENMPLTIVAEMIQTINLSAVHAEITGLDAGTIRSGYINADRLEAGTLTAYHLQVGTLAGRDKWVMTYFSSSLNPIGPATLTDVYRNGNAALVTEVIEPDPSSNKVTINVSNIVGFASGLETDHTVLLETYLVLDQPISSATIFTTYVQGYCNIYIDEALVGTTGSGGTVGVGFQVNLNGLSAGTHKLSVVYQYINHNGTPANSSLIEFNRNIAKIYNGGYISSAISRTDCYANVLTYIDGNRIVTRSINAESIGAGTIDTQLVTIQNLDDPDNYTKIFAEGIETYVNGTKRIVIGKIDADYGFALLDSTGTIVMRTDTSGDLWLQKHLVVGSGVGLSGEGIDITDIRIWAGAPYEDKGTAPFRVTQEGYMYARNAYISGVLETVTFKYDEITANAGSLIIIESDYIVSACTVTGAPFPIVCSRNDVFSVNDIVRIKQSYIADCLIRITSAFENVYTGVVIAGSTNVTFPEKTPVLNYGQTGAGHILLHAADNGYDNYTYIDINETINDLGSIATRVRLGDLSSITDTDIQATALSGWGLYASNVYIKGIFRGPKISIDSINGTFRIGNSDEDFKLKFDGTNLVFGNGTIEWANLSEDAITQIQSQSGSVPDWVTEWDSNLTQIGAEYIVSPRMFSGINDVNGLTGIAIGREIVSGSGVTGIAGYNQDVLTFALKTDGSAIFGTASDSRIVIGSDGSLSLPTLRVGGASANAGSIIVSSVIDDVTIINVEIDDDGIVVKNSGMIVLGSGEFIDDNMVGMSGAGTDPTSIRIWAGSTPDDMANAPFYVRQDGFVNITNSRIIGSIKAGVFDYGSTSVISGKLSFGNAATLSTDVTIADVATPVNITFNEPSQTISNTFKLNDSFVILYDDTPYWFKVTANTTTSTVTAIPIGYVNGQLPVFRAGSVALHYGQSTTRSRLRLIGSDNDTGRMYMDIVQVPKITAGGTAGQYNLATPTVKLRIGDLSDIVDATLPVNPSGYGLYADNAFIKGVIYSTNAHISNSVFTGSIFAGTVDTDNILIADRRVSGGGSDDWKFVIHPDDTTGHTVADKTKYKLLMCEQGVFNKNYTWNFYYADGNATTDLAGSLGNIVTNNAFARIDAPDQMILSRRLSTFAGTGTYYYQTELFRNALRLHSTATADTSIDSFNPNTDAVFAVSSVYNMGCLLSKTGIPIVLGNISESAYDYTTYDTSSDVKIGINDPTPVHNLDIIGDLGVSDTIYFTNSGTDEMKIVKRTASAGVYTMDFYII